MKMGIFRKGLRIFFVFLVMVSVGINGVATENNTNLNGNVLSIYNSSTTPLNSNTSYNIVLQKSGETILEGDYKSDSKGNLVLVDDKLNIAKIQYAINQNSKELYNGTLRNLKQDEDSPPLLPITPEPSKISITSATVTAAPTQAPASEEKSFSKKLWNYKIHVIIIVLFILAISALIFLSKLKQEKDPEQTLINPAKIHSNFYKLKVELVDDYMKIPDITVRAITRKGIPQSVAKSDINGQCILDLPKGTYIIKVEGGMNYEDHSQEIKLSDDDKILILLIKRQPLQIDVVDESGLPIKGIGIRVKEATSGVDAKGTTETDPYGIAKFTVSKGKQYVVSVSTLTGEYINPGNIPLSSSETTKRIQLIKKAGTLEITVSEQATGKSFAGIPVSLTNKGTSQTIDFVTDNSGRINQKMSIGDYIIRLKPSNPPLYDPIEKQMTVIENRTCSVTLDFRFNYQSKPEFLSAIGKINEKLNIGFKEVSAYDTCIPLFFKKLGEKPTQLVDKIIKRPAEFLGAKTSPDEIIKYTLSTGGFLADEISRIMREKSNVDFYFSIQNLPSVDDLTVSDYSQEKFSELVRDTANYHKNHFREVGNKLNEIDNELTQLSGTLTIQPVADLWRVAQKLQENSINETDAKKRGVMLFINDKLLDHVREMYTIEEVKARLKISMF